MKKKALLTLTMIFLLACNFLFPPQVKSSTNITTTGYTFVRLHPQDGDLQTLLADEARKATGLGQMPVIEFDATWCPPCQAIEEAFGEKNELMLAAYDGTYIVKLDVDEWGWENGRIQGFGFTGIPVYFKLDAQGKQTGEVIDGGAWNADIPENIAPVMDTFFHGQ